MDTLGTITPQVAGTAETAQRTEVLERLRFLAQSGSCGTLTGASGSGKTCLLSELGRQLRREGYSVAQLNFAGITGREVLWQISARLGSGLTPGSDALEVGTWLQEYAEASRSSRKRLVFLIDQIDQCDETVFPHLSRTIDAFGSSCAWIFAASELRSSPCAEFLHARTWLKIELKDLTQRESQQVLSRSLTRQAHGLRLTPDGMDAAYEMTHGRLRSLQQLAEIAALAAESEDLDQIDSSLLREMARELA